MRRFLIVFEKTKTGFSAYCPDLPGCVAAGSTRDETEANMVEALQVHIAGLIEDGLPVPEPHATAEVIALPVDKAAGGN